LYQGTGIGWQAIVNLKLGNGIYIVAAYDKGDTGHCFVIDVQFHGNILIYDNGNKKDINWVNEWMHSISFVRRIDLTEEAKSARKSLPLRDVGLYVEPPSDPE
jgi:hypothetical protein